MKSSINWAYQILGHSDLLSTFIHKTNQYGWGQDSELNFALTQHILRIPKLAVWKFGQ